VAQDLETIVAVLTQRFNDHEQSCNQRMVEVRQTFDEVKKMNQATHAFVITLLVSALAGSIGIIVAILVK
jgi:hypothetical protein